MTTIHKETTEAANARLRREFELMTGKPRGQGHSSSGGEERSEDVQARAESALDVDRRPFAADEPPDSAPSPPLPGESEWERCCQETIDTSGNSAPRRVSTLGKSQGSLSAKTAKDQSSPDPPQHEDSVDSESESGGDQGQRTPEHGPTGRSGGTRVTRKPETTGELITHAVRSRLPPRLRLALSGANRAVLVVVTIIAIAAGLSVATLSWPRADDTPATTAAGQLTETPQLETTIVVSVAGAVVRPGIVEVPEGSRVADAIEEAGGLADGADPGMLNLARVLNDGDLIAVVDMAGNAEGGDPVASSVAGVNVNAASAAELTVLNGVGPVMAERIVDFREQHGSFQSVEDLLQVSGIGPAMLEKIRDDIVL